GVRVGVEGHAGEREVARLELMRTAGWLRTTGAVLLEAAEDLAGTLRGVRGALWRLPERLLEYGLLRWQGPEAVRRRLAEMPEPEVSFNYLGQWDNLGGGAEGLLRPSEEGLGGGLAPEERRAHLVDVTAQVVDGRLEVEWSY